MRPTRVPGQRPHRPGKASDLLHHGPVAPGSPLPAADADLALPHERDESTGTASTAQPGHGTAGERQREVMRQAAQDLRQGQVDTDLHASPGLDARRREELLGTSGDGGARAEGPQDPQSQEGPPGGASPAQDGHR